MFFSNDFKTFYINKSDANINLLLAEIDSISFGDNSYNIYINYNESKVQITNSFANDGVSIALDGADVVVNSINEHQINYYLSGNTSAGSFKIYSESDFNLILNNANITNNDGSAINIQSNVKCKVFIPSETINNLSDGDNYSTSEEDQKATFFSEAKLIFEEDGELNINSSGKHAICSDEYIIINNGNFNISAAAKDGIHTNEYFTMNNGNLTINAFSDAIESEEGFVTINNGIINIISADDGIKAATSIEISNATININKSVEGIEAPFITINSGNIKITASDDSFNATKGNGGEKNDGSILTIKGGTISVNSTQGDGLDSNGNIVISGGTISVHGPQGQPEVGLDYNGTCSISGGLVAIAGPSSNMAQGASSNSTQYSVKVSSKQSISANTIFHIQDADGKDILTFKPVRNYSTIVFSSPELINGGTYYIYTGGTSTGTETNGLYIGGTYSGGTQKKSFKITKIISEVSL
jgi:hypothetical protein